MKTSNRNLGSVMKPVQTMKVALKAGLLALMLGLLNMSIGNGFTNLLFFTITIIIISFCLFLVPWEALDHVVT